MKLIWSASDPIAELQTAVSKIPGEMPRAMCQKYIDISTQMSKLQKVVSVGGAQIDK